MLFKMSIFIDTPAFNSISPNFNSLTTYSFHPNSMVCYSVNLLAIMQWRLLSLFRKIHFSILERKKHVVVKRGNKLLFRVTVGVFINTFSPMIILYNMIFTGLQTVRISQAMLWQKNEKLNQQTLKTYLLDELSSYPKVFQ